MLQSSSTAAICPTVLVTDPFIHKQSQRKKEEEEEELKGKRVRKRINSIWAIKKIEKWTQWLKSEDKKMKTVILLQKPENYALALSPFFAFTLHKL